MYNDNIEALIAKALANGVPNDKEKKDLINKVQSMGIDQEEFELVLNYRLSKLNKQIGKETVQSAQKSCIPPELDDLIKEYLTDGIISAKERLVLLNKAQNMGLDVNEVDLYIDAQQQKADQAVAAAMNKRRGKTCPYCGSSIPELTDKCPNCGANITPEASNELQDIFEHLESALVDFKSGEDVEKNKAEVERYVRKARMYYGNNPKIKNLLEEVELESEAAEEEARKNARKTFWLNSLSKNKNTIIGICAVFLILGIAYYYLSADYRYYQNEYEEAVERDNEQEKDNLTIIQTAAEQINYHFKKGDLKKATDVLIMCEVTDLELKKESTTLYKSLVAHVAEAYLEQGKKRKAQKLAITCSSKFKDGRTGLQELFLKLGSNENLTFDYEPQNGYY